jgi:hypothetical protein
VWLWVYLVVKDLLRDIKNLEDYPQLLRRFDSFPSELKDYFARILGQTESIFAEETAKILLTTLDARRPLPVLAYKFLIEESRDPQHPTGDDIISLLPRDARALGHK